MPEREGLFIAWGIHPEARDPEARNIRTLRGLHI